MFLGRFECFVVAFDCLTLTFDQLLVCSLFLCCLDSVDFLGWCKLHVLKLHVLLKMWWAWVGSWFTDGVVFCCGFTVQLYCSYSLCWFPMLDQRFVVACGICHSVWFHLVLKCCWMLDRMLNKKEFNCLGTSFPLKSLLSIQRNPWKDTTLF